MNNPLYKKGDIVRLQDKFFKDWGDDFSGTGIILKISRDCHHLHSTGDVYKILIGDKIDFYHECRIEFAKDCSQS